MSYAKVYAQAARKTGAFLVLSLVLGLAVVTLFSGDLSVTGNVVSEGAAQSAQDFNIMPFMLGVFVGGLIIGTYFLLHAESKRQE